MSVTNVVFTDFKVIGLKEGWENFKGPLFYSLLGAEPEGHPPIKVEVICYEEVKKQMKIFKVRNGSRIVASAIWQTYKKQGKTINSFRITDLSLMPLIEADKDLKQRSTANVTFVDFKLAGFTGISENQSKTYITLEEAMPLKENPPINVSCVAFEDILKQMKNLKVKNGSRLIATARWQTFIKDEEIKDSFKITNLSLMPVKAVKIVHKPKVEVKNDNGFDLM